MNLLKKFCEFPPRQHPWIVAIDNRKFVVQRNRLKNRGRSLFRVAVNFINILRTCFSYEILAPKITKLCYGFEIFWRQNISKKSYHLMLMKLTPGRSLAKVWMYIKTIRYTTNLRTHKLGPLLIEGHFCKAL